MVGESGSKINEVFERKVLYTNLSEPMFMGDRSAIMSLLTFADKVEPTLWRRLPVKLAMTPVVMPDLIGHDHRRQEKGLWRLR